MRISDWSSDVCSSDLVNDPSSQVHNLIGARIVALLDHGHATLDPFVTGATVWMAHHLESRKMPDADRTVRRRMDRVDNARQRGVSGKGGAVRVDLGGRRELKQTKKKKQTLKSQKQDK